jgi:hypothetical protein
MPLAHILGTTPHVSPLLRKARRLGYAQADDLVDLAVARGCRHYAASGHAAVDFRDCGRDCFTNEELGIALVSGSLEGDARHVRVAAQLLGAPGVNAAKVARLARMERCVPIIRYIAEAGLRDSGEPSFWKALLEKLPASAPIPEGRMPHPSRFMSQPGWSPPSRPVRRASWLRAHG